MANDNSTQAVRAAFRAGGGLLTAREARARGLHPQRLARLVERGDIERVARGVYRLTDDDVAFGIPEELLEVQLRAPHARPCLLSALHLHGLTTTRPARSQFAVPNKRTLPVKDVEVFYFGAAAYDLGTQELPVANRVLTTYTPEKTLADLLRYAKKLGRDVYLEGLRNYLREHRRRGTRGLEAMAEKLGVLRELRRDLEVLLHEADR